MNNTTFDEIFERSQKHINELRKKLVEAMSAAFAETMAAVFKAHPEVKTIYWQQYVPYFNDGDECVFQLNEIHFSPADAKLIDGPHFDDETDDQTLADFQSTSRVDDPRVNQELDHAMDTVIKFLENNEDHLETTFGANAFIKITADGVYHEEMEPPY
jgi:hypothetical protein